MEHKCLYSDYWDYWATGLIYIPPHLIIVAPILQDISRSWLHMEIFGYFQEIMSKKCENSVWGKRARVVHFITYKHKIGN